MEQEKNENPIEQLINVLSTPIAQRKGVTISAEDCKIWVEELRHYLSMQEWSRAMEKYTENAFK